MAEPRKGAAKLLGERVHGDFLSHEIDHMTQEKDEYFDFLFNSNLEKGL